MLAIDTELYEHDQVEKIQSFIAGEFKRNPSKTTDTLLVLCTIDQAKVLDEFLLKMNVQDKSMLSHDMPHQVESRRKSKTEVRLKFLIVISLDEE